MSDSNTNGPVSPKTSAPPDKSGETVTVSCDELIEFEENGSQPASAWPWPEPAFVRDAKAHSAKD
jgi:hypothetical protein